MGTDELPPRVTFEWWTVDAIPTAADAVIAAHRGVEDRLAALPGEQWTLASLREWAQAEMDFSTTCSSVTFGMHVSTDKAIRKAAAEAEEKIDAYAVESGMRQDLFHRLTQFAAAGHSCSAEEQRAVDRMLRDFRRNGMALPEDKRTKLMAVQKEISELSSTFSKNLNEDTTKESFTRDQLSGMGDDFLEGLEKDGDDRLFVTLQYPDIIPVMRNCTVAETRRRMDYLFGNKCRAANVPLLERTLELRSEMAQLLSFPNFSAYQLEIRMAKTTEAVLSFVSDLREKMVALGRKELEVLLRLKKDEQEKIGANFDGKVNSWDFQYLHTCLMRSYQVDDEAIKEYFPLERVTSGMLKIYQSLLGLRFEPSTQPTWHDDVSVYAVYDASTGQFMGHFYLDLHPREGKYGHAAVFPLQRAGNLADGSRQLPACAMLCNFSKPVNEKPSLLKFQEVVTYFHEFGHVMHNICTEAQLHFFSGTRVERDFVEAPSQMLENWCYEKEALGLMSGHYKDGSPLPLDLTDAIVAAKNVNVGLLKLRQLFFGTFDLTVHMNNSKVDTESLWARLRPEVSLIDQAADTNPAGSFGHIMGGYQSSYYGYMWSEVFSSDLFSVFKEAPMSPELGARYRRCILAPGGSQDGLDMVRSFLEREPSQTSFLKDIGLESTCHRAPFEAKSALGRPVSSGQQRGIMSESLVDEGSRISRLEPESQHHKLIDGLVETASLLEERLANLESHELFDPDRRLSKLQAVAKDLETRISELEGCIAARESSIASTTAPRHLSKQESDVKYASMLKTTAKDSTPKGSSQAGLSMSRK